VWGPCEFLLFVRTVQLLEICNFQVLFEIKNIYLQLEFEVGTWEGFLLCHK
jgi:hypothetical protein